MRTTTRFLALAVIGLVAFMSDQKLRAATGLWDFNTSNLTQTAGATLGDMTYNDGLTAAATLFGTTTGFAISNIAAADAIVMKFPATTNGLGYRVPTPAANFGVTVNQYTYIVDVYYPTASDGKIRPLIQTEDGTHLGSQQFIVIDSTGGIGPRSIGPSGVNGPYVGTIAPNTWYRIAISVTAGGTIRVYTNGVAVGSFSGGALEGFFALNPSASALVLADTSTNSFPGYVNSIQLRDAALNAGQIAALGSVSAAGIPLVIPPVPSFIDSRTPDVGATGVSQVPAINIVLNEGDTIVNSGTIQLKLDGAVVGAVVTPSAPTYTVTYTVPSRLDPLSVHTLALIYSDSVAGFKTNTWTFTVKDYQVVTLPAPFYFQDFNSLTEDPTPGVALPVGWSVSNQTATGTAGYDLANRDSDSYKDWILVSNSRFNGWEANRTNIPTVILNGVELTTLTSGNLLWAESDARCGSCNGQFADLFTGAISCTGRSNVFVAFNSIYMQNQDNMNFMEYSVDGGVSWLPVLYMFDNDFLAVYGPAVTNITTTFATISPSRNWSPDTSPVHATNYGSYIKATINTNLIPYVKGHINDGELDGKRIEVIRLAAADGQANVRFRLNANGTSSWFWGIDDFGLYEINTPVISGQPANITIAAGTSGSMTVVASSPSPLSYQWQHEGTNISNGGHYSGATNATLTISNADPNDAGAYKVKVTNTSGFLFSSPATLTVVTVPTVATQPISKAVSDGYPATFSVVGFGGLPLTYEWRLNGTTVVGTGSTLSILGAHAANAGNYTAIINNSYGSVTSRVARLIVSVGSITNNLVVHLKFDGNYLDSSPVGTNNATAVGTPSVAVAGKIGNAMQFTTRQDGSEFSYATLGYPADLKFGSATDFSIAFWVNYSQTVDDPSLISNKDWGSSGNRGWIIADQPGSNFRLQITGTGGTKFNTTATPVVKDGTWHHIAVTVDRTGSAVATYKDGALVSDLPSLYTGSVDTDDIAKNVNVGQDGTGIYTDGGSAGITNALIDDVGIWRRALSLQEAAAIYNAGQAGNNLAQVVAPALLSSISITVVGANVNFTWTGGTGIRLQKSSPSVTGTYVDIGSTLGNSTHSEAISAAPTFYRLFKP